MRFSFSLSFFCSSSRFCLPPKSSSQKFFFYDERKKKGVGRGGKGACVLDKGLLNVVVVFLVPTKSSSSSREERSQKQSAFFCALECKKNVYEQKKRTHKTHIMFRVLIPFCLSFFLSFAKKKQIPFLHGARSRRHKTHTR